MKPQNPDNSDVTSGAGYLLNNPYIAFQDRRRNCQGISKDYYNTDLNGSAIQYLAEDQHLNLTDVFIIGTVESINLLNKDKGMAAGYTASFKVEKKLEGYPEYAEEGDNLRLLVIPDENHQPVPELIEGKRYLIRAYFDNNFGPGIWGYAKQYLKIKPLIEEKLFFMELNEDERLNWNEEPLLSLKDEIELLNTNLHTFNINATKDMSALPLAQESSRLYYLTEGRWINSIDNQEKNKVCVVHNDFAKLRGLSVGDKVSLSFRNKTDNRGFYLTTEEDCKDWKDYPTYEEEFEIVGLFSKLNITTTSHTLEIYIPNSCLPEDYRWNQDYNVREWEFSFVLNSSQEEDEFINMTKGSLQELGYELNFIDNNSSTYWGIVKPLIQSYSASFAIFTFVLILSLIFISYLFINQNKYNFAIERALGTPKNTGIHHLLRPMAVISIIAIILGTIFSWPYALSRAMETLATVKSPSGMIADTSLNPWIGVAFIFSIFVVEMVIVFVFASILSKQSVIDLMHKQDKERKKKIGDKENKNTAVEVKDEDYILLKEPTERVKLDNIMDNAVFNPKLIKRYTLYNVLRARFRSILIVGVSAIFMLSLLWMNWTISQNKSQLKKLYLETEIDGQLIKSNTTVGTTLDGIIAQSSIDYLMNTDLIKDIFVVADMPYESILKSEDTDEQKITYNVIATNKLINSYDGIQLTDLDMMDGFALDDFQEPWNNEKIYRKEIPILLPLKMANKLNLQKSDNVNLMGDLREHKVATEKIVGIYESVSYPNKQMGTTYNIDGNRVIIPLSALEVLETSGVYYSMAEFTFNPLKNKDLLKMRDEMKKEIEENSDNLIPLRLQIWDEELREVAGPLEKNLSLLRVLYPIILIVSAIVSGFIAFLMILQRTKDSSIMRILGVPRSYVRKSLVLEVIMLTLAGLILGILIMLLVTQSIAVIDITSLLIIFGSYLLGALLGSLISAKIVLSKQPLEMLDKE